MNWQVFTSTRSDILDVIKADITLPPGVIMFEDPPVHAMHRGLMSRVFTPRRMAALEDQIRAFCVRAASIPSWAPTGFDIIDELASVMPMRVIGMLLGIPEQDQIAVRDKTDHNLRTEPGRAHAGPGGQRRQRRDVRGVHRVARPTPLRRPHDPCSSTPSSRTRPARRGPSPEQEVLTYTSVIAGAGNETTGRLIGWLAKMPRRAPRPTPRGRRGPHPHPTCHRRDPPFRAHRPLHRPLHDAGLRAPRRHHPRRLPVLLIAASANRDPRRYAEPRHLRHPPVRHPAPDLRVRRPLLPRRQPRPPRRPSRPRRAPQPLPRVGRRLRQHEPRPDVDRPRVGAPAAHPPPLTRQCDRGMPIFALRVLASP